MTTEDTLIGMIRGVHARLDRNEQKLSDILVQATKTNGRVNRLEDDSQKDNEKYAKEIDRINKTSMGVWASSHPFKFSLVFSSLVLFLVSDSRELLIGAIMKAIKI